MTLSTIRLPLVAAVTTLAPIAANAQQLPPRYDIPAVRTAISACNADVAKYCPTVVPGGGRIIRCLAANRDQITPFCRDSILAARSALGQ